MLKNSTQFIVLGIFMFLQVSFGFCQEKVDLILVDGYTNEPIPNESITVSFDRNKRIELTSDKQGNLTFTGPKKWDGTLSAKTKNKNFEDFYGELVTTDFYENALILYPSKRYEEKKIAIETERYGPGERKSVHDIEFDGFPDSDAIYPSENDDDLQGFISRNVSYPLIDLEMNTQEKIFCSFIVEKDGQITHVKVLKGESKSLCNEAKRMIRSMPNWIPAQVEGEPVRVRCKLPINFVLN